MSPGHGGRGARLVLGGCVALLLSGCSGASGGGSPSPSTSVGDESTLGVVDYAAQLEQGVDAAREDDGLHPLTHDDCAARAAAGRAEQLVGEDELTHRPLDDVLEECAVALAAENLSRASEPPQEVVAAWLASAGHAANIRNSEFVRGAVACEQDGEEAAMPRMVCVQIFLAE